MLYNVWYGLLLKLCWIYFKLLSLLDYMSDIIFFCWKWFIFLYYVINLVILQLADYMDENFVTAAFRALGEENVQNVKVSIEFILWYNNNIY